MNILIIDNYDSFTYNLYQMIGELVQKKRHKSAITEDKIEVFRNDEITLEEIKQHHPDRIILSPGPGNPEDEHYFGIGKQIIQTLGKDIPILGVCLGMQGIVAAFGGKIKPSKLPMHGKVSCITHNQQSVFRTLPPHLDMMRYHSLEADPCSLPECLQITAIVGEHDPNTFIQQTKQSKDIEIMGIQHKDYPIHGVQFHPESFASEAGEYLLSTFLFHTQD